MATIARKSDGRRIFTDAFKRQQIDRVWRGELTLSELGRKLGIARSLLHRWKRHMPSAAAPGDRARHHGTPTSGLGTARYIRDLQLMLGKQTVELELVRAELESCKRGRRLLKAPR